MSDSKVALVTGASGGIGRAIAASLASKGCRVAVHYRSGEDRAQRTLGELSGTGHEVFGADLNDPDAVLKLVEHVGAAMGSVDVVVNNAGIYDLHPFEESDYARWQQAWSATLTTNLVAAANLSYCAAQAMKDRGGRIVNVSSRGAFRGEPTAPAYGASKAGMNAMSQSLAKALAPHGVLVFAVAPGFVETEMSAKRLVGEFGEKMRGESPLGRVSRPDEVASAVCFCALDAPEAMTGAILDVNGASYLRT